MRGCLTIIKMAVLHELHLSAETPEIACYSLGYIATIEQRRSVKTEAANVT